MHRRFLYHLQSHLGNFAHNIGQRVVLNHTIVYNETVRGGIHGYILLIIEFYAHVHMASRSRARLTLINLCIVRIYYHSLRELIGVVAYLLSSLKHFCRTCELDIYLFTYIIIYCYPLYYYSLSDFNYINLYVYSSVY